MSTPFDRFEEINASLDDELTTDELRQLEDRLARDADLRAERDEFAGLVSLLRDLPQYEVPRSFALTPDQIGTTSPKSNVIRMLPVVRALSIAAVLAFIVVSGFTLYDMAFSTDEETSSLPTVTNDGPDASDGVTGDSTTGGNGVTNQGESAASDAVAPEAPGNPASNVSTPDAAASEAEDSPVPVATTDTSDDDDSRWLLTSAGLGVLALALLGLWTALARTSQPETRPA